MTKWHQKLKEKKRKDSFPTASDYWIKRVAVQSTNGIQSWMQTIKPTMQIYDLRRLMMYITDTQSEMKKIEWQPKETAARCPLWQAQFSSCAWLTMHLARWWLLLDGIPSWEGNHIRTAYLSQSLTGLCHKSWPFKMARVRFKKTKKIIYWFHIIRFKLPTQTPLWPISSAVADLTVFTPIVWYMLQKCQLKLASGAYGFSKCCPSRTPVRDQQIWESTLLSRLFRRRFCWLLHLPWLCVSQKLENSVLHMCNILTWLCLVISGTKK